MHAAGARAIVTFTEVCMNTLKFKAGDDVPGFIAKPMSDCEPLKHIKFAIDVEAFFFQGSWHVLPMEPRGERSIFRIETAQPNSVARIEGGPTITYEFPLNDYQRQWIQSWAESKAAMPANYGDRSADQYKIENAVVYLGRSEAQQ